MAKIIVARMTGEGEQWNIECEIPKVLLDLKGKNRELGIQELVRPLVSVMDTRMVELNQRIMDGMQFAKGLSPEQQFAIQQVFDIMGGRAPQVKPPQQQPVPAEVVAADQDAIAKAVAELKASGEAIESGKVVSIADHKAAKELQGV